MINLTREEAQQVLDAFLGIGQRAYDAMSGDAFHECSIAVSRLRFRLSAPEPESVMLMDAPLLLNGQPLYTAPPQRDFKFSTTEEAMQLMPAPTGELQLTNDELEFANAMTTLIKAGYGKEADVVLKSKREQLDVEDRFCQRLAVMLEASLLNPERTWDDAHKLLDEYQRAIRQQVDAAGLRYVSPLGKD